LLGFSPKKESLADISLEVFSDVDDKQLALLLFRDLNDPVDSLVLSELEIVKSSSCASIISFSSGWLYRKYSDSPRQIMLPKVT